MAEEEEQCCKICYCEGTSGNELYCPCKCTGSIKFVHENCLQHWQQIRLKPGSQSCEVCSTPYYYHKLYGYELLSIDRIWQTFLACLADANAQRICPVVFTVLLITLSSTANCFAIFVLCGGRKVVVDLGDTEWLSSRFLWTIIACLVVVYIPAALVYQWRFGEVWSQRFTDLEIARAFYKARALAQRREQAMFGLEDLLSLQHRYAMTPKPMMLDAQVTYVAQLSASYARTTETAAVVGDEQLIRRATDCVSGVLPLETVPMPVRKGRKGLTEALHLADEIHKIPPPEPLWLLKWRLMQAPADRRVQRLARFDLAPIQLMFAFIVYVMLGNNWAPRTAYFANWAATCVHTLLSSQDRVKWLLWLIYASSAGFDDAATLALLQSVLSGAFATVLAMCARLIVGGTTVRIHIAALTLLCPLSELTQPLYSMQTPKPTLYDQLMGSKYGIQVLTVYDMLLNHVYPTLLCNIGTWLSPGLLCLILPSVMSMLVLRALGQPSLTVSLCAAMYCGCVCFYAHARCLLTELRKVLAPWYSEALRDLAKLSIRSAASLCTSALKLAAIVLLLFIAIVVLPIRFSCWLCPGASKWVLPEHAEPRGSDSFLLLVHGCSMTTLLFHAQLQQAVCQLLAESFRLLASLIGLDAILAPSGTKGALARRAVAPPRNAPPRTLDLVGLIEQAPRWSFQHFHYAVIDRIWKPVFHVMWVAPAPVPALLSPSTWLECLSVVSRFTLLVILFLAGNFVLSSWLLHAPLLVGNCVHTALFGAAGMPLPTVGVFQYCTGAVCCVLAVSAVKGICREVRRMSNTTVLDMVCVAGRWLQRAGAVLAVGLLWATVPTCLFGYLLFSTYSSVFTCGGGTVSYTVWDCGFWGVLGMLVFEWVLNLQVFAHVQLARTVKQVRRRGLAVFQAEKCLRSVVLPVCLMLLDCAVLPYFVARCAGMLFVHSYHVRARLVQFCHLVYLALYVARWAAAGPLYDAYLRWYDALFLVSIKLKNYEAQQI